MSSNPLSPKYVTIGYGILLVVMFAGVLLLFQTQQELNQRATEIAEAGRPANLSLIFLTAPECVACPSLDTFAAALAKQPTVIREQRTIPQTDPEAAQLIALYGIIQLPAALIQGEIDKPNIVPFLQAYTVRRGDAAVLANAPPPFLDLVSGGIKGLVSLTYLTDRTCKDCYDPTQHRGILEQGFGVAVSDAQNVDVHDPAGRALIEQYKITAVPTVLLSSEAAAYPTLMNAWNDVGTVEIDGRYVFRNLAALSPAVVYKDLKIGSVVKPPPPSSQ